MKPPVLEAEGGPSGPLGAEIPDEPLPASRREQGATWTGTVAVEYRRRDGARFWRRLACGGGVRGTLGGPERGRSEAEAWLGHVEWQTQAGGAGSFCPSCSFLVLVNSALKPHLDFKSFCYRCSLCGTSWLMDLARPGFQVCGCTCEGAQVQREEAAGPQIRRTGPTPSSSGQWVSQPASSPLSLSPAHLSSMTLHAEGA